MQPHQEPKNGTKKLAPRAPRSVAGSSAARRNGESRESISKRTPPPATNPWATGLGVFSVGLGLAEVLVPGRLAELSGLKDSSRNRWCLRMAGVRELVVGAGLLTQRRPTRWLWSRVLGDVVDLALLGTVLSKKRRTGAGFPIAMATVAGVTAVDVWASYRRSGENEAAAGPPVPLHAVVTIDRPAAEIYTLWRAFENLPRFMSHVRSVEVRDNRKSHWTVSTTGHETLEWDAVITVDRPNQLIAWRSVEDAAVDHSGEVRFVEAPGNRGTEVHLTMNVLPPGGAVGRAVGKLAHRVPEQIIAADLRRLKQLLEIGEVMKSDASIHEGPHPAQPESGRTQLESARREGAAQ